MPLYRFKAGYVGELEAPSPDIARQIVCQQVNASMMLAANTQHFSGFYEGVEVTAEMLAAEERERKLSQANLRSGIIRA